MRQLFTRDKDSFDDKDPRFMVPREINHPLFPSAFVSFNVDGVIII